MSTIARQLEERDTAKRQGKVEFLKFKTEIADALMQGWSGKDIWTLLKDEKKISISYQMFQRYCSKYIELPGEDTKATQQKAKRPNPGVRRQDRDAKEGQSSPTDTPSNKAGPTKVTSVSLDKGISSPAEIARNTKDEDLYWSFY